MGNKLALDVLIEWIEEENFGFAICNNVTGLTLLKNKIKELRSLEKQNIIDAYLEGLEDLSLEGNSAEKYFNETYK